MFSAKVLLDSISPTGKRLTTFEITFPRCVLAEFNTHRAFSRNSASSRAIPIEKMLEKVKTHPFVPEKWGKPAKGMGAKEYWPADSLQAVTLREQWFTQLEHAIQTVELCKDFGNKEDLNRLLEPFMWHTVIVTATEWANFFFQRTDDAADWKIQRVADLMYDAYHAVDDCIFQYGNIQGLRGIHHPHKIQFLKRGEWHCPLVFDDDEGPLVALAESEVGSSYKVKEVDKAIVELKKKISTARCARISYLTHDGKRDLRKDLDLYHNTLLTPPMHPSPFEHVATPYYMDKEYYGSQYKGEYIDLRSGNFIGWWQHRKDFPQENVTDFKKG